MIDPNVLERRLSVPPDLLWARRLAALESVPGATLQAVDESRREARFTTGMSLTSWGENMVARVTPDEGGGSILRITGQVRHTFLTTAIGERGHRRAFVRRLMRRLDGAS